LSSSTSFIGGSQNRWEVKQFLQSGIGENQLSELNMIIVADPLSQPGLVINNEKGQKVEISERVGHLEYAHLHSIRLVQKSEGIT
jgi:hypothetical protein